MNQITKNVKELRQNIKYLQKIERSIVPKKLIFLLIFLVIINIILASLLLHFISPDYPIVDDVISSYPRTTDITVVHDRVVHNYYYKNDVLIRENISTESINSAID